MAPSSASSILPPHLTRVQPLRAIAALALDWALIIACLGVAVAVPHPVVMLLAALLIARTQLALAVLMHDAAHGVLMRPRWLNDLVGQVFAAAPLMVSLAAYRHGHLQHHRTPMAPNDPVAIIFRIDDYPVHSRELIWRLLKDLVSLAYFVSLAKFVLGHYRHLGPANRATWVRTGSVLISILGLHGVLLGGLWAAGRPDLYFWLWILPSLTLFQLFARIRAITEHAGYGPSPDQTLNARSIVAPNWQTFFCGPHSIHYHIEHHAHVRVPFYHLREVHRLMQARGQLPQKNLHRGYGTVLKEVSSGSRRDSSTMPDSVMRGP